MAYSEPLAERLRAIVEGQKGVTERKMFGGLAFMIQGNMCCGIVKDSLMLRMGDAAEAALTEPHTRPMDFTGKPMRGMLYIDPEGIITDEDLGGWVSRAVNFAKALPAK